MSPATKAPAQQKLAAVANKIGYPDKWRDYITLIIKPNDALGNQPAPTPSRTTANSTKLASPSTRMSGR